MSRRLLITIVKACISTALIIFVLRRVGLPNLLNTISAANIPFVLLGVSLIVFGVIISSYKWHILLLVHNIEIGLSVLVSFYFVSMFWRNLLSTVGGEGVKIYSVSKLSGKVFESVASVLLERGTGLLALLSISAFALVFGLGLGIDRSVVILVMALYTIYFAFLVIIFNKSLFEMFIKLIRLLRSEFMLGKIKEMHSAIYIYKKHGRCLVKALAISFVYQIIAVIVVVYVISLSLDVRIPLLYFFIFCPIIGIFEMLPISLNGLGIREGAFLFFFTKVGVSDAQALSMSFLMYAIVLSVSLIGGVIYALRK